MAVGEGFEPPVNWLTASGLTSWLPYKNIFCCQGNHEDTFMCQLLSVCGLYPTHLYVVRDERIELPFPGSEPGALAAVLIPNGGVSDAGLMT